MKKSSAARRVPRKVTRDDDDDEPTSTGNDAEAGQPKEPVVKRPNIKKNRASFSPAQIEGDHDSNFTPKKSNLSRLASERNAERKSRASLPSDRLPFRATADESRPSYSKDYLQELRNATPSRPADLDSKSSSKAFSSSGPSSSDISTKFGPLATASSAHIPTEAEIREKKQRRARLAKENEYISLYGSASEDNAEPADGEFDPEFRPRDLLRRQDIHEKEKYPESRIVHDDEDIAEGFEEYTEDGRLGLSRKARKQQKERQRKEMESLIQDAEGVGLGSDEDSEDDSEEERNKAFEAAQTRHGTYNTAFAETSKSSAKGRKGAIAGPPKERPLPDLSDTMARLKNQLKTASAKRKMQQQALDELENEKKDLESREGFIQDGLKDAGEKYEKLRSEIWRNAGNAAGAPPPAERGLNRSTQHQRLVNNKQNFSVAPKRYKKLKQ
ncbi:hypothetical protein K402DRAFT_443495 [Aulographum hederae CBS 113979]|uniref:Uncharacterized protein n=1 Tax=Aulographum hederae CBS 113979 TaxID=1176131 RepID=A0A6G1HFX5_9PEZI|nr:hypothetical protein K402DRAFT_443495 [Aulographum hederae CBS 113979]